MNDINEFVKRYQKNTFIAGSSTYSFHEFFQKVSGIASNLASLGVKKRSIIFIHEMPFEEAALLIFAVISLKAIALPLNPKSGPDEIKKYRRKFKNSVVFSYNKKINKARQPDKLSKISVEPINEQDWDYNIPAIIVLTSGSTAEPKMVVHSLYSFLFSANAVNSYFGFKAGHSWLLSLPLHHVSGLAILFRCLSAGACLIIAGKTDLNESLRLFKPTHLSLVATQLWRLLSNKRSVNILKSSQVVFVGGSSIPQSLIKEGLSNGLPLYTSYGLSEMASTVAIKKINDISTEKAMLLTGYEVKISREGEILVKGKALFSGYYTGKKLVKGITKDGWFCTGDLGVLEKDRITVVGRKDNMFISGGENIYPEEIERLLLRINGIESAVVIAVQDIEYGQRPVAFVKKKDEISEGEIIKFLKQHLPGYKIPDRFLAWPEKYGEEEVKLKREYFKSLL